MRGKRSPPDNIGMQIKGISTASISPSASSEQTPNAVQVKLMKKVLDSQKEQMAKLFHQMQGVGRNLDVSV